LTQTSSLRFHEDINENVSRPISRVLYGQCESIDVVIIHLGCQLPDTSPQPTRTTDLKTGWIHCCIRVVPIRFCSRWGLPCRDCYQYARWALTPPFHPYPIKQNLNGRYIFCGTFPWACTNACPAGCYPASCFLGARTFLHCVLSEPAAAITRPTDIMTYKTCCD